MKKSKFIKSLYIVVAIIICALLIVMFIIKPMKVKNLQQKRDSLRASNEQIIKNCSDIVEGNVISMEATRWNTADKNEPKLKSKNDIVYQDIKVKANKVLKGSINSQKTITVRVYKSNELAKQHGIEKFESNENVILFLRVDDSIYNKNKDYSYYIVDGGPIGKYDIKDNTATNLIQQINVDDLYEAITNSK